MSHVGTGHQLLLAGQIDRLNAVPFQQLASDVALPGSVQHQWGHEEELLGDGTRVCCRQGQSIHEPGNGAGEDAVVRGQHAQLMIQVAFRFPESPAQVQVDGRDGLRQAVAQLLQLGSRWKRIITLLLTGKS